MVPVIQCGQVMHIDPAMPHGVPSALMNLVFRVMTPWVHRRMQQLILELNQHGGTYLERIARNPGLYQLVERRFHRTKPPAAPSQDDHDADAAYTPPSVPDLYLNHKYESCGPEA
eukprot:TRINITY_DN12315_c0_g1_i1.p1 TRINITY_DN12315_c0_g1~~TRINITY_DN12315_c0_g1_i1.p1  ORF type:complete len:115 (-),score=16.13 TRINITY_DN12315_c0_g1_i1:412-756(-)